MILGENRVDDCYADGAAQSTSGHEQQVTKNVNMPKHLDIQGL